MDYAVDFIKCLDIISQVADEEQNAFMYSELAEMLDWNAKDMAIDDVLQKDFSKSYGMRNFSVIPVNVDEADKQYLVCFNVSSVNVAIDSLTKFIVNMPENVKPELGFTKKELPKHEDYVIKHVVAKGIEPVSTNEWC